MEKKEDSFDRKISKLIFSIYSTTNDPETLSLLYQFLARSFANFSDLCNSVGSKKREVSVKVLGPNFTPSCLVEPFFMKMYKYYRDSGLIKKVYEVFTACSFGFYARNIRVTEKKKEKLSKEMKVLARASILVREFLLSYNSGNGKKNDHLMMPLPILKNNGEEIKLPGFLSTNNNEKNIMTDENKFWEESLSVTLSYFCSLERLGKVVVVFVKFYRYHLFDIPMSISPTFDHHSEKEFNTFRSLIFRNIVDDGNVCRRGFWHFVIHNLKDFYFDLEEFSNLDYFKVGKMLLMELLRDIQTLKSKEKINILLEKYPPMVKRFFEDKNVNLIIDSILKDYKDLNKSTIKKILNRNSEKEDVKINEILVKMLFSYFCDNCKRSFEQKKVVFCWYCRTKTCSLCNGLNSQNMDNFEERMNSLMKWRNCKVCGMEQGFLCFPKPVKEKVIGESFDIKHFKDLSIYGSDLRLNDTLKSPQVFYFVELYYCYRKLNNLLVQNKVPKEPKKYSEYQKKTMIQLCTRIMNIVSRLKDEKCDFLDIRLMTLKTCCIRSKLRFTKNSVNIYPRVLQTIYEITKMCYPSLKMFMSSFLTSKDVRVAIVKNFNERIRKYELINNYYYVRKYDKDGIEDLSVKVDSEFGGLGRFFPEKNNIGMIRNDVFRHLFLFYKGLVISFDEVKLITTSCDSSKAIFESKTSHELKSAAKVQDMKGIKKEDLIKNEKVMNQTYTTFQLEYEIPDVRIPISTSKRGTHFVQKESMKVFEGVSFIITFYMMKDNVVNFLDIYYSPPNRHNRIFPKEKTAVRLILEMLKEKVGKKNELLLSGWKKFRSTNSRIFNYLAVDKEEEMKCAFCSKYMKQKQLCSTCKKIFYCSKKCQKFDWKRHKKWCNPF